MKLPWHRLSVALILAVTVSCTSVCPAQSTAVLPEGVKAVWDMSKAFRETTPTRERICMNGLWQWQPADENGGSPPAENWGYFKVPGPWPKTKWKRAAESQYVYPHPSWKDVDYAELDTAWYQREVEVPKDWSGRRIFLEAQYVNTSAEVFLDGRSAGAIRPRGGRTDVTAACKPGQKQTLTMRVHWPKTNRVNFRGLCGDVYLEGTPHGACIDDVKIDTSVRRWEISVDAAIRSLDADRRYALQGELLDGDRVVKTVESKPFQVQNLSNGRMAFTSPWKPEKLWDIHTPQNQYHLKLKLLDDSGKVLDEFRPVRFGFREFWIDGRDFRLNGTRIYLFLAPLDIGEISAYAASYDAAKTMIRRFHSAGVNLAYAHNYTSAPGAHVSFEEIFKACDDFGMLVSFAQPEFPSYPWNSDDAETTNGYAEDVEIHVRQAQNHPSVVMYTTSHNATGYAQDQDPDRIDGIYNPYPDPENPQVRSDPRGRQALRAEAVVKRFDASKPIYQHSSGNMSAMYTLNCYLNFVPIQERSDWFEHWAVRGVKPLMLVEYGEPYLMTWTNQRGMRANHPVEWYPVEWGAQFRGDAAYDLPEAEKKDLRPRDSENMAGIQAAYIARNWPAFRTWGVSAFNKWEIYLGWNPRPEAKAPALSVRWDDLQKPGFSADFVHAAFDGRPRWDICFQDSDWIPNSVGRALLRYNRPLLAFIAGKPARFTERNHNFLPGETVEKQAIVINNSRKKVVGDCSWSLDLPQPIKGQAKAEVETGEQARIPMTFALPNDLPPGAYPLRMTARFDSGETQEDTFTIDVLPPAAGVARPPSAVKKMQATVLDSSTQPGAAVLHTPGIAVFDPNGETEKLLSDLGVKFTSVASDADAKGHDLLILGKRSLTLAGPKFNFSRVRDGLKVLVFEQTAEVLEQRLGFRVQEYGLRDVFPRVPAGSGVLTGLKPENLRDWRGEATLVPPRLEPSTRVNQRSYPTVQWCGFQATRPWRCGCQGTVASVMIEKPAAGDFLPLIDGGFALQNALLLEYREGTGMVLFCQLDVTGRTENDPAAMRLAGNILDYVATWKPGPRRKLLYAGEAAGKDHLIQAGFVPADYRGGPLAADQVLAVGPGAGEALAAQSKPIADWLGAGGRLLAVGLEQDEINRFLPLKVKTRNAEYVCGDPLPPQAMGSPLAGIAPAELYVRPYEKNVCEMLPLLTGGTKLYGGGSLGLAEESSVVFYQIAPWRFDSRKRYDQKPSFRRSAFALSRLLANLGVEAETPLLENLGSPVPSRLVLEQTARGGGRRGGSEAVENKLPNVQIWLEAGRQVQVLPSVWKGLPITDGVLPKDWETIDFDDASWRDIRVPGIWEEQFPDLSKHDGLFLYRVAFEVSEEMARQDVHLILGSVADEDWTYVNGRFVGSVTHETNPKDYVETIRTYRLPKGLLKPGRNVAAVKVNDLRAAGGLRATMFTRRGAGVTRWLSGLYLDKPEALDDPYRYYRW